jgi:hypothetical protein
LKKTETTEKQKQHTCTKPTGKQKQQHLQRFQHLLALPFYSFSHAHEKWQVHEKRRTA